MGKGANHIAAGLTAALALPVAVLALGLPLMLAVPMAGALYAGVALALAPQRRLPRVDFAKIGSAQAQVVAELIGEADGHVAALDAAARELKAPELRTPVENLAASARAILGRLAAAPEKLPAVRRFLAYYLPRSVEIAQALPAIERRAASDAPRRASIVATLAKLGQAFAFYADGLDQADLAALDVELKLVGAALAEDLGPEAHPVPAGRT